MIAILLLLLVTLWIALRAFWAVRQLRHFLVVGSGIARPQLNGFDVSDFWHLKPKNVIRREEWESLLECLGVREIVYDAVPEKRFYAKKSVSDPEGK